MLTNDIRQAFIDYFVEHNHEAVPEASLIPLDDPSLLFVNAGMVQFKNFFLGTPAPFKRAVTAQPCLRVGGKHNDLKNVGHTTRHHTLFEMLGNFSFGDYFKEKAIKLAWQFITDRLNIPQDKLWVTIHHEDDESYDIWLNIIGVEAQRIIRCGDKDNFWSMGDTGPCGPCTEIFYDHGPEIDGGLPGTPDADGDRYVEIWNLVFMQFDRQADGSTKPLPVPCVDTGMGIERIAAVMQGVTSNFETDGFRFIMSQTQVKYPCLAENKVTLQVIADHIRSATFIIANGINPGNEGRAYVLRRIIRRALRYGYQSGQKKPFMFSMVSDLVSLLGQAYPILSAEQANIESALKKEEEKFFQTLSQGMQLLNSSIQNTDVISGELAFKLYDTYGFPIDIAEDIANEKGLSIDLDGYAAQMAKQRARSKSASKFAVKQSLPLDKLNKTDFVGAVTLELQSSIEALLKDGQRVDQLQGDGQVVLGSTPFYPEGGGQVGDAGVMHNEQANVNVLDTQKYGDVIVHQVDVKSGQIHLGDEVFCVVDAKRLAVKRHHSATHLLHAALRQILGLGVEQKGSLVDEMKLRFDFTHKAPLTNDEISQIESLVNEKIYAALPVVVEEMSMTDALSAGAIALFSEKYQKNVRVLSMGDFSKELCGGTHVSNTQEIGIFKIVAETGVASGIRRIEAVAGDKAQAWYESQWQLLNALSEKLKITPKDIAKKVNQLLVDNKKLKSAVKEGGQVSLAQVKPVEKKGYALYIAYDTAWQNQDLMAMADQYKQQDNAVVCLFGGDDSKPHPYVLSLNKKGITDHINAKEILKQFQSTLTLKGGGRDDLIRGACQSDGQAILQALETFKESF